MDLFHQRVQKSTWNDAWDSTVQEADDSGSKHVFMSLHGTYFRRNRFYSVIDLDRIKKFQPDIIITLIDDAHEVWHRIQTREKEAPRGTNMRLRDVFLWRTAEIMTADFMIDDATNSSYVVSVKHPQEMVRRLTFDNHRRRVYASFPISSTRDDANRRAEVDQFRHDLHDKFTAFDPLTIDERVLTTVFKNQPYSPGVIRVEHESRWPLVWPDGCEPMAEPYGSNYPIDIPADELQEVIDDIDRQIEARDYRLIDQAQAVAAYRPNYQEHFSRGVQSELLYASQTSGIPVHLVWDDQEDGEYGNSPFGLVGTKHDSVTGLLASISQ